MQKGCIKKLVRRLQMRILMSCGQSGRALRLRCDALRCNAMQCDALRCDIIFCGGGRGARLTFGGGRPGTEAAMRCDAIFRSGGRPGIAAAMRCDAMQVLRVVVSRAQPRMRCKTLDRDCTALRLSLGMYNACGFATVRAGHYANATEGNPSNDHPSRQRRPCIRHHIQPPCNRTGGGVTTLTLP